MEKMQNFESSFLLEFEYDQEKKLLNTVFKNGKSFLYADVPRETWDELQEAESKGGYYAKNIKGKFEIHKEID